MIKDKGDFNYYQINEEDKLVVKKKLNTKKIIILILFLVVLVMLLGIVKNSIQTINDYEIYKKQQASLKREEEEKIKAQEAEKERKRQEKIPKLTQVGKDNMSNIYKNDTKIAYLTFDDGPSGITNSILDVLKQENVTATFFVLGSRVEAKPEVVKRIYEDGHYIANHGYSHVYSFIYSSPQAVLDEFNRCNDAVKAAIGVPEYNSHLFRFPGGFVGGPYAQIKGEAKELLEQNDILNIDWNSLSGDGETNKLSVEFEMKRLQETTQNKNTVIVLMHDAEAKKVTAESLPQIIRYLKEQGYEFKNFYQIIK